MASPGSTHQLEFLCGPLQGRVVPLQATTVVGRLAGECDLVVADASVSRRHARLELEAEGLRVVDESSRNGVWLGARRVSEALLRSGDEFKLGDVRVLYRVVKHSVSGPELDLPLEELDLELPDLDLSEPSRSESDRPGHEQAAPARRVAAAQAAALAREPANRRPERASAAATRGILQYSRHEQSAGLSQGDFAQLPGWMKAVAIAVALVLFAAVFALAFRGGAWLRGTGGGAAAGTEADGEVEPPVEDG
jgi:hypothetical protein